MKKFFILMLFALNMVYFQQALASSPIDQNVIFYEEGNPEGGEEEDEGAKEEDCE